MLPNRKLYRLPQKQIDRAQRRQNHDLAKVVDDAIGIAPSSGAVGAAMAAAVVGDGGATQTQTQTAAGAGATMATSTEPKRHRNVVAVHRSPADVVASLPLLRPFRIRKPAEESPLANAIVREQCAADALAATIEEEEKLRGELRKAANDASKGDDENGNDAPGGNDRGGTSTAKIKSKRSSNKKQRSSGSSGAKKKVREIESRIDAATLKIARCRDELINCAGWTKAMLQAEYSKRAVTLDPSSPAYAELEEAFSFLCPPAAGAGAADDGDGDAAEESSRHEQRLAYVRETMPAMKKAGERDVPASLMALPYIAKFQCADPESPVVAALIEEMHQLAITEAVRARLEKQTGDAAKFRVLRHAEEALDRREAATSELVRRHYRKRSVRLHPDRNGEHVRPTFEDFTDARTVLSDVRLRQSYLRGMLDVFKYYGTTMMSESHDAWNRKHRPDVADDGRGGGGKDGRRRGSKDGGGAAGEPQTLKLEGGLHQQTPRGAVLHHRTDGRKNHVVAVGVHVPRPAHEFYARVRSVRVEMRDASDEKIVVEKTRREIVENIKIDRQGPILANEIPITEQLLSPGHWEVFWCATLDTVGTDPLNPENATFDESVATRPSAVATFHVVDYDHLRKCQDFDVAEKVCKVIRGELANTLHKLRTKQLDSASMFTPSRFGHYHKTLVRARKKCFNLHRLMIMTGKASSVHDSLSALLAESRQVFVELEQRADVVKKRKEKKDDAKRFKAYIASVLESDEPLGWMQGVTEAQLYREGGDVNRLYQLFFEGKGKCVLMVDSEVYKAASLREDMFSAKQCKDLAARGEEVAIQEAKEEEEARTTEENHRKEEEEREKMRKEAEMHEKWAMVGQNAKIHGLTSEKGKLMNRQTARILYYVVEKDRFEVQLYNSAGEKAYLKKENLALYYGHVPKQQQQQQQRLPSPLNERAVELAKPSPSPPAPTANQYGSWNCDRCTFENDDASIACSMCTNPRLKAPEEQPPDLAEKVNKKETDMEKDPIKTTVSPPLEKTPGKSGPNVDENDGASKFTKTLYVRSVLSKKLTGKRGRKKKDLMNKSGADDIQIETSAIGNHVPVNLMGTKQAVLKAVALIRETIGEENVSEEIAKPPTSPLPSPPLPPPTPVAVSPPAVEASPSTVPSPVSAATSPVEPKPITSTQQPHTSFVKPGMFSVFEKTADALANGFHHVSLSETETQPTSQYSFGDALLPRGLMDLSVSVSSPAVPPELPSEIGINSSQGMARESITEASVSSLNDRSNVSKTYSSFTLNENDPLLVFLRAHQQCVKGSVDEFYIWLVKSEDIDTMTALKEAVTDEDYLNDSMKVGNGSCGLKGFKRKAFARSVIEHEDVKRTEPSHNPSSNDASSLQVMNGNAILPSNLFSGSDKPTTYPVANHNSSYPPEELICPIGLVLMTADPVLAADGVTYERASIENWFRKNITNLDMARENLKWNPHSERDQRVVKSGIRSPAYGTLMPNLSLTPNTSVRNMARAFKERKDAMSCY